MSTSFDTLLLRIIDKTSFAPTGTTDGGLTGGDITPFLIRVELLHSITNRTSNVTIVLFIPPSQIFTVNAPKLMDDDAQNKYYIEGQLTQGANSTRLFRLRIGQPTLEQEDSVGEVIKIPVVGIEYIAREWPTSKQDPFLDAKQRFINLITEYNANKGADNPTINAAAANIDLLGEDDSVRLNWDSFAPRTLTEAQKEIIDRQVQPGVAGGTFKDKYVDWIPSAAETKLVDVVVKDFGGTSSGITIDAETLDIPSTPEKKTGISDQLSRKTVVIYKFHPAGASLPMEKTRFESQFLHAKIRKEWDVAKAYKKEQVVKFTHVSQIPNVIRYFEAVNDITGGSNPDVDQVNWKEDFTIIPPWSPDAFYLEAEIVTRVNGANLEHWEANNDVGPSATPPPDGVNWSLKFTTKPTSLYTGFTSNSPWSNDLDAIKKSCLKGQVTTPAGFVGAVPDWNLEVPFYDRVDYTNDFKHVSGRSVREKRNNPPGGNDRFHGSRYVVDTAGSGVWIGENNKIATWNRLPIEDPLNPRWLFSDAPVDGDTIMLEDEAQVLKFDGTSWIVVHDLTTDFDKSSPFHLCKNIKLVADKSGIPGQAVELEFEWDLAADAKNTSSRGAWYYEEYPLPPRNSANFDIGALYGGQGSGAFPSQPFIDSINLDVNHKGLVGWNRGLDSEDHGRIGVHVIGIKIGFFRSQDDTILTKEKANIPMIYWRRDLFGRVYFHEFTIPRNNQWWVERVPIPPIAPPTQLYHNRLDELAVIYGYTIPTLFGLPEKEFSGVRFDHKFAKSWGVMYKESYSKEGFYIGTYNVIIQGLIESAQQLLPDILEAIDKISHGIYTGLAITEADAVTNHVKLSVGTLYYEKEGYALSQDVSIAEPRFHIERDESELDYINAKVKAKAIELRKFELLNEWHFKTAGDVRMAAGLSFQLAGPNIPNSPQTHVCQEVKHIVDNDGSYTMEVSSIIKRVTPI